MPPFDQWMSALGSSPGAVFLVAFLLGLRHATDPDHVAAVSTLVLSTRDGGARLARRLGAMWGLGHGTTLFLLGLPVVAFRRQLPAGIHQLAELAVAAIIVGLAVRLLVRWSRGYFHVHPHVHEGLTHAHPHLHEHAGQDHPVVHQHRHAEAIGRSARSSFSIGLIHGVGGSAGAGILLVSAAPTPTSGIAALLVFAVGTMVSMTILTYLMGAILTRHRVAQLRWLIPALGVASLCFGMWYGFESLMA